MRIIFSKTILAKEKEREKKRARRKKGREEEKSNGHTINFHIGFFGEKKSLNKKLLDGRGLVGDNVH